MNGFTDKEVIGGLIAVLVTSYAAFFGWVVASIGRLDRKIDALDAKLSAKIDAVDDKLSAKIEEVDARLSARIDMLDAKLNTRIDTLDARLSARLEALTIAVSRLEGAMWGRTPPEPPRKAES
jgi:hypothetical protein